MDLSEYLSSQGIGQEAAAELIERKAKSPHLTGVVVAGRWISLSPPTEMTGQKFDEMVENGNPPMSNTDREFLEGNCNGSQFQNQPDIGDNYRRECESKGGSTLGRKYLSQLARFPGDPEAWVSGRGDVQKVLEERGWGSDGSVKVKARGRIEEAPKPIPIAEHIVDRETAKEIGDGVLSVGEYKRVREKVKRRITPPDKRE